MKRTLWATPLIAITLAATPAYAADAPESAQAAAPEEATIHFVNNGGIRDWHAEDRETLYIQDRHRQWYKATLMSPAHDLPYALAIGFDTGPIDRLDKFSSVVVKGQRYAINSLVKVDGLPKDEEKAEEEADA